MLKMLNLLSLTSDKYNNNVNNNNNNEGVKKSDVISFMDAAAVATVPVAMVDAAMGEIEVIDSNKFEDNVVDDDEKTIKRGINFPILDINNSINNNILIKSPCSNKASPRSSSITLCASSSIPIHRSNISFDMIKEVPENLEVQSILKKRSEENNYNFFHNNGIDNNNLANNNINNNPMRINNNNNNSDKNVINNIGNSGNANGNFNDNFSYNISNVNNSYSTGYSSSYSNNKRDSNSENNIKPCYLNVILNEGEENEEEETDEVKNSEDDDIFVKDGNNCDYHSIINKENDYGDDFICNNTYEDESKRDNQDYTREKSRSSSPIFDPNHFEEEVGNTVESAPSAEVDFTEINNNDNNINENCNYINNNNNNNNDDDENLVISTEEGDLDEYCNRYIDRDSVNFVNVGTREGDGEEEKEEEEYEDERVNSQGENYNHNDESDCVNNRFCGDVDNTDYSNDDCDDENYNFRENNNCENYLANDNYRLDLETQRYNVEIYKSALRERKKQEMMGEQMLSLDNQVIGFKILLNEAHRLYVKKVEKIPGIKPKDGSNCFDNSNKSDINNGNIYHDGNDNIDNKYCNCCDENERDKNKKVSFLAPFRSVKSRRKLVDRMWREISDKVETDFQEDEDLTYIQRKISCMCVFNPELSSPLLYHTSFNHLPRRSGKLNNGYANVDNTIKYAGESKFTVGSADDDKNLNDNGNIKSGDFGPGMEGIDKVEGVQAEEDEDVDVENFLNTKVYNSNNSFACSIDAHRQLRLARQEEILKRISEQARRGGNRFFLDSYNAKDEALSVKEIENQVDCHDYDEVYRTEENYGDYDIYNEYNDYNGGIGYNEEYYGGEEEGGAGEEKCGYNFDNNNNNNNGEPTVEEKN